MENIEFTDLVTNFKSLPQPQDRIVAFTFVRDLKYGDIGSRNPMDVLAQKKGTCSGKHALLKMILEELGYEVESFFARHDFAHFPISTWPEELKVFQTQILTDFHDFLKIKVEDQWVIVDAMFDKPLADLGFPVQDWDGFSNLEVLVKVEEVFPSDPDMEEHKKKLISCLPEQVQVDRKTFLKSLTQWIDSHRV